MSKGKTIALRRLASTRVTLLSLLLAAAAVLFSEVGLKGYFLALPAMLLLANLLAAVMTNTKLQRSKGLLGFHLALALLSLLVVADRLMALDGHVEVTEGTFFDPGQVTADVGPLHEWRLDRVRFSQGEFGIAYAPKMKRRDTVSQVVVPLDGGRWQAIDVGDDTPLVLAGYRFYTSFNKGFAPIVTFTSPSGHTQNGSVHLPSYPLNHYRQGNTWHPEGAAHPVKLWLHIPQAPYTEDAAWSFRKPAGARLVVLDGKSRHELREGQTAKLSEGRLRYDGLRTWMGYTISYNPLVPWILATAAIALLFLLWHILERMRQSPWDRGSSGKVRAHGA